MTESEAIAVVLSRDEWRIVQEALDIYYYETEHSTAGGFLPRHREGRQVQRDDRLGVLAEVDRRIGAATGLGPLFG